ncbi:MULTISPECIES: sensor histidine kinase [unclassified Acinetobacter]|uniref:sensor histidine kinase n=1 Tax=unclassified Acinetobacter TaxID=196816 RepID=UPI00190B8120|nr:MULTISPECIES: histidine kinase [unclassified Acinetobacter]MBK0064722.1 histidine kinase [Acinetobacter sp. S55]MBK0068040.1 histidine kinase [Acinetobacter sp. S54]
MWSCWLGKKKRKIKKSITNSSRLADAQSSMDLNQQIRLSGNSYFFTKIGQWQHLLELIVASNVLAIVLALAEAGSWQTLQGLRLMQYVFFINWVVLSFSAILDHFHIFFNRTNQVTALVIGFILLQIIVFLTTCIGNILQHWGSYFTLHHFNRDLLFAGVDMHLSYGILLGAFCLRYMYVRDQWLTQQYSELNARIQAMQARIHPHFLFNSLNSVVSLISLDPDKAETMLISLSKLFRASFQQLKLVTLNDEIELCRQYLFIEQIRLGDRFHIEWKIPYTVQQLKMIQIPLLTLQPLLENSIFHGVEKIGGACQIGVLVEILQNQVSIVITNPYSHDTIKTREGHGIAIDNVKQRLRAYYGNTVKFQTYSARGLYTTVVSYQYQANNNKSGLTD